MHTQVFTAIGAASSSPCCCSCSASRSGRACREAVAEETASSTCIHSQLEICIEHLHVFYGFGAAHTQSHMHGSPGAASDPNVDSTDGKSPLSLPEAQVSHKKQLLASSPEEQAVLGRVYCGLSHSCLSCLSFQASCMRTMAKIRRITTGLACSALTLLKVFSTTGLPLHGHHHHPGTFLAVQLNSLWLDRCN